MLRFNVLITFQQFGLLLFIIFLSYFFLPFAD